MDSAKPIINKVAQRAIITLDLEDYFPKQNDITAIDLKAFLFKELILKEADFRETVKNTDWTTYRDKLVALHCSSPAIIPMWAYMILSAELSHYAKDIACTPPHLAPEIFLYRALSNIDMAPFTNQRVVVKGCGERQIPEAAYVQITRQLSKVARVIMYGEPCSSVPVFKKVVD